MERKVFEIIAKVMGVPVESVNENSSPATIAQWDSLRHMRLVLAVEEALGLQFTEKQIVDIKNAADLLRLLPPISATA